MSVPFAILRLVLAMVVALDATLAAAAPGDLHLVARVDMPGVEGRLDHLAFAQRDNLLFVAGLGADTVQVIDVGSSRPVAQLPASEPQGLAFSAALHRVYVANGHAGTVEAFEGSTRVAIARNLPDADNLRLDDRSGLLYVGYGRAIAALDVRTLAVARRFALPGHPEAFEVSGDRVYVNVPAARAVIVLEQEAGTTARTWHVAPAGGNFPMAIDPAARRLFIATRQPAGVLVFDMDSGQRVAELQTCSDADDLFLGGKDQVLAICGDGHVDVIRAGAPNHYEVSRRLATAVGARTGLFVAASRRLFVAAPAREGRQAAVLVYDVE
ncbi:YncE family protein [Ramlibacter sp. MMS24-I3-19]|uniref:YncE family protein n=1 Tax=Ramlibacter sp. MMS24-I3-19 TaxID=3416606 RepID=UPI003D089FC2